MPVIYDDENSYLFHSRDRADICFACNEGSTGLLVVREIKSMMLVHLCPICLVNDSSRYLLDNTKPWLGEKGKL